MHRKKHGFTIIETSLVLAIAGLILVMVFVALPALQRQARDAKRKEDTATFLQALKKYQQNNRGNLPSSKDNYSYSPYSITREGNVWDRVDVSQNPWAKFYNQYLGDGFKNPDGEKYTFLIQTMADDDFWDYNTISTDNNTYDFNQRWADLFIFLGATCEDGQPTESTNDRNTAIITRLEAGTFCADIQSILRSKYLSHFSRMLFFDDSLYYK